MDSGMSSGVAKPGRVALRPSPSVKLRAAGGRKEHVEAWSFSAWEWLLTHFDHTQASPDVRRRFVVAARNADLLTSPSNGEKLRLYALYKQCGGHNAPPACPRTFDIIRIAKWEAWHSVRGKSSAQAMALYSQLVEKLVAREEERRLTSAGGVSADSALARWPERKPSVAIHINIDEERKLPWWASFTSGTVPDAAAALLQRVASWGSGSSGRRSSGSAARASLARRESGDLGIEAESERTQRRGKASGQLPPKKKTRVGKAAAGRRGSLHPMRDAATPFAACIGAAKLSAELSPTGDGDGPSPGARGRHWLGGGAQRERPRGDVSRD